MRPFATAEIIAVGSELLTPTRVDTNSLAITAHLQPLGIQVRAKAVVGDRPEDLAALVRAALARVDLVILSGGLGPTDDDVTREAVAQVLGRALHEDASITDGIRTRFQSRGLQMPEINRRQAMVPEGAVVLPNPHGTAPGLWIEHHEQALALLPGPPRELIPMLEGPLNAYLLPRSTGVGLHTATVRVFGRGESHVEEAVRPFYPRWARGAPPVEVTILAARGAIDLHLTTAAPSRNEAARVLEPAVAEAVAALGDDVYSTDGRSIEEVVGELLRERGWRVAVAESCTGGMITARLTDVPGSSDYVDCGVASYSNRSKVDLLGVPAALIEAHGAVSEPVAEAMARGVRLRAAVELGIAVTGIAGPGGGTPDKPTGTVVFAVETPEAQVVRTRRVPGGRDLVRAIATHAALDIARRLITGRPVP